GSSDVCSSDLDEARPDVDRGADEEQGDADGVDDGGDVQPAVDVGQADETERGGQHEEQADEHQPGADARRPGGPSSGDHSGSSLRKRRDVWRATIRVVNSVSRKTARAASTNMSTRPCRTPRMTSMAGIRVPTAFSPAMRS